MTAKGLPALEYLLFDAGKGTPALAGAASWQYAQALAAEFAQVTTELHAAWQAWSTGAALADADKAKALVGDTVNVVVAALNGLRAQACTARRLPGTPTPTWDAWRSGATRDHVLATLGGVRMVLGDAAAGAPGLLALLLIVVGRRWHSSWPTMPRLGGEIEARLPIRRRPAPVHFPSGAMRTGATAGRAGRRCGDRTEDHDGLQPAPMATDPTAPQAAPEGTCRCAPAPRRGRRGAARRRCGRRPCRRRRAFQKRASDADFLLLSGMEPGEAATAQAACSIAPAGSRSTASRCRRARTACARSAAPRHSATSSRRPGAYLWRIVRHAAAARCSRRGEDGEYRYEGHVVVDAAHARIYATESHVIESEGRIGVYDADTLRRLATWTSGGIGPHELLQIAPDVLAVANGGILTLPRPDA